MRTGRGSGRRIAGHHLGLVIRMGSRLGMPGYWLLARHEMCLIRTGKGFARGLSNRALNEMEL